MKTWVLYHANCYDGFGAAWTAWRALGDDGVTYHPTQYGDAPPFDGMGLAGSGDRVYLLDFSLPRAALERYASVAEVTVLDHHASAAKDLQPLVARDDLPNLHILFDVTKSGAVLAWEHFHPNVPVPTMLRYVQDRDLWAFALPFSREAAAWMRSWPFEFLGWDVLADHFHPTWDLEAYSQVVTEGLAILRFQDQQVKIMADAAAPRTIGGYQVPVVNATLFFSEVGEELCRRYPAAPFAAYYLDRADGKRQWGLRSRGGFDCTTVAKQYGGGGHPGAAGFTTAAGWLGE